MRRNRTGKIYDIRWSNWSIWMNIVTVSRLGITTPNCYWFLYRYGTYEGPMAVDVEASNVWKSWERLEAASMFGFVWVTKSFK